MSEPKKKRSQSRKGKHRSHQAMTGPALMSCADCKSPKVSHQVCPTCGMYDGKQAIIIATKKKK